MAHDLIPQEDIESKILLVREKKVMIDRDLALLYEVDTRVLNQTVKRNIERFPDDFMFQLSKKEFEDLKSQFVTSSWGGVRKMPFAFTEQGVAMLSSVLNSKRAIQVNIQIIRAFTRLREMISGCKELQKKIEAMEGKYDKQFKVVFDVINELIEAPQKAKKQIGFKRDEFMIFLT